MQVLTPEWAQAMDGIGALSTLRGGGVSGPPYDDGNGGGGLNLGMHVGDRPQDVRLNRLLLRALLPAEPVWLEQVHGTCVIDAAVAASEAHGAKLPQADASVAHRSGVVCAVLTADCLPVLFADPAARVVGAAHAGWRGLAGGVLENTVAHMRAAGASGICAWLGPAIGAGNFEVGEDVLRAFVALDARHRTAFRPIAGREAYFRRWGLHGRRGATLLFLSARRRHRTHGFLDLAQIGLRLLGQGRPGLIAPRFPVQALRFQATLAPARAGKV